jgi:hypothetical protein
MSSLQTHPEEGALLRYLDGELPGRKSRHVRGHLEACWQCRAAIEDLEGTVAACVEYRKEVLQKHLEAPQNWADLSTGFAQIDVEFSTGSWTAKLGRWFAAPRVQRWALSGAVAVALAIGIYHQLGQTPSVQAATLLKRAVAAAPTKPAAVRVRGNFKNRAAIPTMLKAAHYNADEPLSARSFQEWRDALPQKRDEVSRIEDCFLIRTIPDEGELASASLKLRTADLHPVESRFDFRDQQWVEFSEGSTTDGGTPAVTRMDNPTRRTEPSRSAALPSGESASISEELRVLAALHEIGADLGDPVEISRSGGQVLVSGVGIPAGRQREIHRALDPLPNVAVQFSEPGTAGAPQAGGSEVQDVKPQVARATGVQARLEQHLGTRAAFDRFSGQTLDAMENAMAHAHALRSLAQRFPEGTEMSAPDRAVLADLARSHAKTLLSQINEMQRTLAPVLVSLGGKTAQGRPVNAGPAWQPAAERVLADSRRVEVLLSTLLGVTAEAPNAQVPTDLLAAFAELRSALEECQRLL